MPILATHPRPFNEKLLSSWLYRVATEGEMSVSFFCKYTFAVI